MNKREYHTYTALSNNEVYFKGQGKPLPWNCLLGYEIVHLLHTKTVDYISDWLHAKQIIKLMTVNFTPQKPL